MFSRFLGRVLASQFFWRYSDSDARENPDAALRHAGHRLIEKIDAGARRNESTGWSRRCGAGAALGQCPSCAEAHDFGIDAGVM